MGNGDRTRLSATAGGRARGWFSKNNRMKNIITSFHRPHFPRTIQDAIKVARGLGLQYLSVDALCIIQDSDSDKAKELAVIGDIYRHTPITLAAANGGHTDDRLFAQRDA
jgi:Heterokaryon incompatibility protein (HET)